MLIENTEPRARSISNVYLMPGINSISDKRWDWLTNSNKWKNPIKGLIEHGILKVTDAKEKLTIQIVEKTYNGDILSEWLADAKNKGPLRGAIRKQMKLLEFEEAI